MKRRSPRIRRAALAAVALTSLFITSSVLAQERTTSHRARMELAFDHGYGVSTEGDYAELGTDLRLWAPFGLGAVLRTGLASNGMSTALAADLGVGYRVDLVAIEHVGLQLAGVLGPSLAHGPFDHGKVLAFGGFAMIHLDFWYRNFFVGVGVSAHAMASERYAQSEGRDSPILTLTPTLRIGADWGL